MNEINKDKDKDKTVEKDKVEKDKTVEIPLNVIEKKLIELIDAFNTNSEKLKELELVKQKNLTLKNQIANTVLTFQEDIRDEILSLIKPDTTDKTDTKTNKSKYSEIVSKYMSDNKLTSIPLSKAVEITGYTGLYPVNLKRSLEKAGITVN